MVTMNLREYRRNVLFEPLRIVAHRARVSIATICKLEKGVSTPHPWTLRAVARGYKLSHKKFCKYLKSQAS